MAASIVPLITYFMIVCFVTVKKVILHIEVNGFIHQLMNEAHEMYKGSNKKRISFELLICSIRYGMSEQYPARKKRNLNRKL